MGEAQAGNEDVGECLFRPPLYKQRYTAAATILQDERWAKDMRKVVDLGCSELKLVQYFKSLPYIQHLVEVDIDRNTLETYKFRAAPLTVEYLKRREQPLTIDVYQGSVAENDSSLMGADAIVCVELIEHLEPDVLEKMPKTIFGCVQPLVVVISTPNADFNPVFGECKGFRHWDHKFEWTRVEFEDWAKCVINKYPNYTYELSGVGDPPPGSEHVGPCSQIAVFHRQYTIPSPQVVGEFYELVEHYVYPVNDDKRSEDEKIADEITYRVNSFSGDQNFHCENDEYAFVPTHMIFNLVRDHFSACTEEKFQSIAAKRFEIVENSAGVPSIRVELHGWSSDEEQEYEDELVGQEEPFASSSVQEEEEEDWNVEQPAGLPEDSNEEEAKENLPEGKDVLAEGVLAEGERVAPRIEVDWAIRENEENQLAESLRNNGLLCAPPAGYYDEDDDDFNDFFDADDYDDAGRSDDDFEADFHRRGDDCEFMCSSFGSAPKTDALPLEEKTERITDSGVDLPSLRQSDFPKSTSVEVLHSDGPSSRRRAARIEYGDSATLCYTGQDRQGCPRLAESPGDADVDSCSLDEPDRAADSGYPNSSSLNQEVDVDADLTPEQVDDISRSEDGEPSLSEDGQSDDEHAAVAARPAALPARMPLPPVFGNVENGDLANNNRDGEGNNAAPEDDIPGLPLEFAALVHEEEQQPLLAGAVAVEDEEGVLPEDADPFPAWLSDLLGLEPREGTVVRESGGGDASLSDTDEGLGEENTASWSGDAPTSAHV